MKTLRQVFQAACSEHTTTDGGELLVERISGGLAFVFRLVVLAFLITQSRPWRVANNDVERAIEVWRDFGAEAAEREGGGFGILQLVVAEAMQYFVAEIARELECLRRARAGVEFDCGDVETERSQAQGGFADVEAADLIVENVLNLRGFGALAALLPRLADEAAKGEDEKNARAARGVEHLGCGFVFQRSERLICHE